MTTRTPLPAPPLHDAALWLIGAPAAALRAADARSLINKDEPTRPNH